MTRSQEIRSDRARHWLAPRLQICKLSSGLEAFQSMEQFAETKSSAAAWWSQACDCEKWHASLFTSPPAAVTHFNPSLRSPPTRCSSGRKRCYTLYERERKRKKREENTETFLQSDVGGVFPPLTQHTLHSAELPEGEEMQPRLRRELSARAVPAYESHTIAKDVFLQPCF